MEQVGYREMSDGEEGAVCDLVRQVFDEFVAPDYGEEGIDEFFKFVNPSSLKARKKAGGFVLLASKRDCLVGMLEFMPPDRIALLFVTLRYQGIAMELVQRTIRRLRSTQPQVKKLTVHSSPYAEPIYQKMGFHRVGAMTTDHGITYVPMERDLGPSNSSV